MSEETQDQFASRGVQELIEPRAGIAEVRDCLVEARAGQIAQQLLEAGERLGGAVYVIGILDNVVGSCALDELVGPPVVARIGLVKRPAVAGGDERQRLTARVAAVLENPGAEMVRYALDVLHAVCDAIMRLRWDRAARNSDDSQHILEVVAARHDGFEPRERGHGEHRAIPGDGVEIHHALQRERF